MINDEFRRNMELEKMCNPMVKKMVRELVEKHSMKIIKIEETSESVDMFYAIDLEIKVDKGNISCRVRRRGCENRDWTIRTRNLSDSKSELEKIMEGIGPQWYFYAWLSENNNSFDDWMFIDVEKARNTTLQNLHREIINKDGQTAFIYINYEELLKYDCMVDASPRLNRMKNQSKLASFA